MASGNDVLAEIGQRVVQQLEDDLALEEINAHGGEEELLVAFDPQAGIAGRVHAEGIQDGRLLGFLDEAGDALFRAQFHDAQRLRLRRARR